jgi:hypothetical protein
MNETTHHNNGKSSYAPWNKGKLTGRKRPLKPKHGWAIGTRLQLAKKSRDLALFNGAIESTVRYLGVEVDDAIAVAEQVDV